MIVTLFVTHGLNIGGSGSVKFFWHTLNLRSGPILAVLIHSLLRGRAKMLFTKRNENRAWSQDNTPWSSLLFRRFVFRMAEASAKREWLVMSHKEPAFLCAHIEREITSGYEADPCLKSPNFTQLSVLRSNPQYRTNGTLMINNTLNLAWIPLEVLEIAHWSAHWFLIHYCNIQSLL